MAQVPWSLTAGNDLQHIEDFIARDSILHAITFVDRIVESTDALLTSPQIGRVVSEFNRSDIREILFRNSRIVYLTHTIPRHYHPSSRAWQTGSSRTCPS